MDTLKILNIESYETDVEKELMLSLEKKTSNYWKEKHETLLYRYYLPLLKIFKNLEQGNIKIHEIDIKEY